MKKNAKTLRKHVYAHAMWRTGSTALAQCFLRSTDYLVFYEPFHECCGSLWHIDNVRKNMSHSTNFLGHPVWTGGYFDSYKLIDPKTGQPLYALYDPASAVADVYRRPSQRSLTYIAACKRVARAQGKAAFFGFCRSGFQQRGLPTGDDTTGFYLWRDPAAQFQSYNWPDNTYFLPKTIAQLCYAPELRRVLRGLLGRHRAKLAVHFVEARFLKEQGRKDLLLKFTALLTEEERFAVFYLSHYVTGQIAQEQGIAAFSMDELALDPGQHAKFETAFGVSLATLRQNDRQIDLADLKRFRVIQDRVEDAVAKASIDFRPLSARFE
ncbi:hypothetical protein [Yoonia sp. I 8.24]|uniref:hypothetical protein n=1 Tax=Yoonia sp. I 8.24 TaxID=1537229 RepID=UPI001EDFE4EE|nr:hypothetical protein [Yoonia sp. I 8.24]MCG3267578.1 hypothetical protein [Yoonia sp. I 8.24]